MNNEFGKECSYFSIHTNYPVGNLEMPENEEDEVMYYDSMSTTSEVQTPEDYLSENGIELEDECGGRKRKQKVLDYY